MDARTFSQKLNSRKLALAIGVILLSTAMLVGAYISGDSWTSLVTITSAAYFATNVWQAKASA